MPLTSSIALFEPALQSECGEIEIRIFPKGGYARCFFFTSESEAAEKAFELCNAGVNVYFGVNPRIGKGRQEGERQIPQCLPCGDRLRGGRAQEGQQASNL